MLGTTSNDLDPDFDQSSIELSRFLCPNTGDLQEKLFSKVETAFLSKFR